MEWLVRLPFAGDNAKLTYHRTYEEEPREEGEPHPLGGFGSPKRRDEAIFDESGP